MTPYEILPSLIELSIAIAGFSGIAAAIQGRSERNPQVRIFLTSLLWSTFNSAAICVLSMVLLASPLDDDSAWAATSFSHAIVLLVVLSVRSMQRRRGEYTRTRALQIARGFLYALVPIQIVNGALLGKPWIAVAGLAFYSFFGFGFFVLLLLEIIQPSET
jgi:hypothetical protein